MIRCRCYIIDGAARFVYTAAAAGATAVVMDFHRSVAELEKVVATRKAAGKNVDDATKTLALLQIAPAKSMAITQPQSKFSPNYTQQTRRVRAFLLAESFLQHQPVIRASSIESPAARFSRETFMNLRLVIFPEFIDAIVPPERDDDDDDDDDDYALAVAEEDDEEYEALKRELENVARWPMYISAEEIRDLFISESPLDRLSGLETWFMSCLEYAAPATGTREFASTAPRRISKGNMAGLLSALAIETGRQQLIDFVASHVADDVKAFHSYKFSVLNAAARTGNIDIIKTYEFDDVIPYLFSSTAAYAAENGQLAVLKLLDTMIRNFHVSRGDDPDDETWGVNWTVDDGTILKAAVESTNLEMLQWLNGRHGVDFSMRQSLLFVAACAKGSLDVIRWMATLPRIRPDAKDYRGLENAAENNHWLIVKWFFDNTNALDEYEDWFMLAYSAVRHNFLDLLKNMKAALGNRLNLADFSNFLVDAAAKAGFIAMCEFLLQHASVQLSDNAIRDATEAAVQRDDLAMFTWLSQRSPQTDNASRDMSIVFEMAAQKNAAQILTWIIQQAPSEKWVHATLVNRAFVAAAGAGHRNVIYVLLASPLIEENDIRDGQQAAQHARRWVLANILTKKLANMHKPKKRKSA